MYRIVIILFFAFSFSFSYIVYYTNDGTIRNVHNNGPYSCGAISGDTWSASKGPFFIINNNMYTLGSTYNKSKYNMTCVFKNSSYVHTVWKYEGQCSVLTNRDHLIPNNVLDFCAKKTGCYYNSKANAFFCSDSNNTIICPPGMQYSSAKEQCVNIPTCPSGTELLQQAVKKCGNSNYVAYTDCNITTGKITIICKSCLQIANIVKTYCNNLYNSPVKNFTCSTSSRGAIITNAKDINNSLCVNNNSTPQENNNTKICPAGYILTLQNNSYSCVKKAADNNSSSNNNNNSSKDNNSSSNNNNNSSKDNNSSSNNNNNSSKDNNSSSNNNNNSSNNNTCPNACNLRNSPVLGMQTKITAGCYTITNPIFTNKNNKPCTEQYSFNVKGQCVPNCTNAADSNKSDNNVSATGVIKSINNSQNFVNSLFTKIKINVFPSTLATPQCSLNTNVKIGNNTYKFPNILCYIINLILQYPNIFKMFRITVISIAAILGYLTVFKKS